jgi:hypothetical protein
VAVRHDGAAGTGQIVKLGGRLGERVLFSAPGRFGEPAPGPDGRVLLVPWPAADQWLFLRRRGRTVAVGHIARQFAPGHARPPFPRTAQWCCD